MSLILALMLLLPADTEDCQLHYYVRLEYRERVSPIGEPLVVVGASTMIGPLTPVRAEAEALRDEIGARGWQQPRLIPGDPATSPEHRIAPGAFLANSVKAMCCHFDPMWCVEVP